MWLRVLGAAAGGGFPQWNCGCPACAAVRDGSRPCRPRTQSSIAVSADYRKWFVFNASPDIRYQIESFPPLRPRRSRDTPVAAVLLTDAELDHTLGLLLLRESPSIEVHATETVHDTLCHHTGVLRTLERYSQVRWRRVVPDVDVPLGGELLYRAFDVPVSKAERYPGARRPGHTVGYRLTDRRTGGIAVYLPGAQELSPNLREQCAGCSCLLIDGTCWHDDELIELGLGRKTAHEMGHLAIDGDNGSLARLSRLPIGRKIYVHINNSNPILLDDSPQRHRVETAGMEVATDGMEVHL